MCFLVAGRLIYRKGILFLLDALEKLPEELDYQCRIIGAGPDQKRLEARCRESRKLQDHVFFKGKVRFEEMENEYMTADVLVMPSIRETTGSVLLEAMSRGMPAITIKKFGGSLLVDETTGWLYSGITKDDYIESLSAALIECIENPRIVEQKGANAALVARRYTWKNKIDEYERIYRQLLET